MINNAAVFFFCNYDMEEQKIVHKHRTGTIMLSNIRMEGRVLLFLLPAPPEP